MSKIFTMIKMSISMKREGKFFSFFNLIFDFMIFDCVNIFIIEEKFFLKEFFLNF